MNDCLFGSSWRQICCDSTVDWSLQILEGEWVRGPEKHGLVVVSDLGKSFGKTVFWSAFLQVLMYTEPQKKNLNNKYYFFVEKFHFECFLSMDLDGKKTKLNFIFQILGLNWFFFFLCVLICYSMMFECVKSVHAKNIIHG